MANFSGYFDTSGTETKSDIVTVAGLVGEAEDWAIFDTEWLAFMGTENVSGFRMHDFAHFKNSFASGWRDNESRRVAFLDRLTVLTTQTAYKVFVRSIDIAQYNVVNKEYELTEFIGGAYALAQANCTITAMEWGIRERDPSDGIHFFVESGDVGQEGFTRLMKEKLGSLSPLVQLYPKTDPLTGEEVTPYSTCDFVAYEYRRHHEGVLAGADPEKMRGSLKLVRKTLHADVGVITEADMRKACADAKIPKRRRN